MNIGINITLIEKIVMVALVFAMFYVAFIMGRIDAAFECIGQQIIVVEKG